MADPSAVTRRASPATGEPTVERHAADLATIRDRTLVVLAKAPDRGFAKTRLASGVGDEAAARLARAFLEDTIALLANAGTTSRAGIVVAFTPASARDHFAGAGVDALLVLQPQGDLGVRIAEALHTALAYSRTAVLIGTDTPHLGVDAIERAFRSLDAADVVLGPAADGGFYLIGCRGSLPGRIFAGIEWSTATVMATVLSNLRRAGVKVVLLDDETDIDDLTSLRAAFASRAGNSAPRTWAVARDLGVVE